MTEYGHNNQKPPPLLSYDYVQERKAARRKLLSEVEQRRQTIYARWHKKMQLKQRSVLDTIP